MLINTPSRGGVLAKVTAVARTVFPIFLIASLSPLAFGEFGVIVGPETVVQDSSKAIDLTRSFTLLDVAPTYVLRIDNTGTTDAPPVSDGSITLNGIEVVGSKDFTSDSKAPVSLIQKIIHPIGKNQLVIHLSSHQRSALTIQITGVHTFRVFGPENFIRQTGTPVEVLRAFTVANPSALWFARITNGGLRGEFPKVSSAGITLNGIDVAQQSDFSKGQGCQANQCAPLIEKVVTLQSTNDLRVELTSDPGSGLTLEILGIDEAPPVISGLATPPANPNGWNNSDVTVTFTCSDTFSGIAFCTPPVQVTAEGANQIISGVARNNAGDVTTTSVTVSIDKTPPIVSAARTPPPNAAGWNNSIVAVTFTCSDSLSGIDFCPGPVQVSTEGASQVISGTGRDRAGNMTTASTAINLDKTPPTLTITSPVSGAMVPVSPLTVSGNVSDGLSGVASVSCQGSLAVLSGSTFTCSVPIVAGPNSITVEAQDVAGNLRQVSIAVQGGVPTLLSANPNTGQQGQANLSVTITGQFTHFVQGSTTASLGAGIAVASLAVNSPTTATVTINIDPAAVLGSRNITFTTGPETVVLNNGFAVTPGTPVVTQVNPSSGPQGATSMPVTITGSFTHFNSSSAVTFANAAVTAGAPTVATATTLTVPVSITAAASLGVTNITVTTGIEVVTQANGFAVTAGNPVLLSMSPNAAQQGQQNLSVTITGQFTHFVQGVTTANFGAGITVASLTLASPTSATAVLSIDPSAVTGGRNVTMTTNAELVTLTNGFAVTAGTPVILLVNPNQAPQCSVNLEFNTDGVLPGASDGFQYVTGGIPGEPTFGASEATVFSVSNGLLHLNTAALGPNMGFAYYERNGLFDPTKDLLIEMRLALYSDSAREFGIDSLAQDLTYAGVVFENGQMIALRNNLPYPEFPVADTGFHTYRISYSAATRQYKLFVDGVQLGGAETLTYIGAPPNRGLVFGDTSGHPGFNVRADIDYIHYQNCGPIPVTITGQFTHFVQGTTEATFGAGVNVTSLIVNSPTGATATLSIDPAAAQGPRTVTVITGSEVSSLVNGFAVLPLTGPSITTSPNSGVQGQQNLSVAITGKNTHFAQGTTQVSFFGAAIAVATVTVADATNLVAQISIDPSAQTGTLTVAVTTGNETVSLDDGFTVLAAGAPTLLSVNPNTGQLGQQNLSVSITGQSTHFVQGTSQVTFGAGITVGTVNVVNTTSLTAIVSIAANAAIGPRDVTVTTGTEVASLAGAFTVAAAVNQPPIVSAGADQTISLQSAPVVFTEYSVPTPPATIAGGPQAIVTGPDGNLWFTENSAKKIGRITSSGIVTEFPIPTTGNPQDIAAGPDGNLWFTDYSGSRIWRITTAGVLTPFQLAGGSFPHGITAGPDGNLWFTERLANNIGRITPAGVITEYPVPTANSQAEEITVGPDGNLWFSENGGANGQIVAPSKIGRITTSGVITEFPTPTLNSGPYGVTTGPDGNLWFTETYANKIGRITTNGVFTEFPIPTASSGAAGITTGPDGNLWFIEEGAGVVGRLTPAGGFAEFPLSIGSSLPIGITLGPDCNLWFTEEFTNVIGKVIPGVVVPIGTTLAGSVTDDGLPLGTMLSASWNQSTGPAPVSFGNPTSMFLNVAGKSNPVVTSASFCRVGTYTLSLTGSDSQLSGSSNVTITVTPPGGSTSPSITLVSPNSGQQGQALLLTVTGLNTHFVQGTTQVSFGAGITVGALTVASATHLAAQISIAANAAVGPRTVTVTTGTEVASLSGGLTVAATVNQPPVVSAGSSQTITLPLAPVTMTEYLVPTASIFPREMTVGSDGNLWFTEDGGQNIGRITTAGVITEFPLFSGPIGAGATEGIANGPDGNIWFTEYTRQAIGRITPSGVITEFSLPPGSYPFGITAGPDGNLWFAGRLGNYIGRITPSGVITEFSIPSSNSNPAGIAAGLDGNLWFTEMFAENTSIFGNGKIGRITPTGVITEFSIPTASSGPVGITAGSDGNLWFTEASGNKIGKITPAGALTEFSIPTVNSEPGYINTGPDGNVWFTEDFSSKIARITPSGVITEFATLTASSRPQGITVGPDCQLWFAEGTANKIVKMIPGVVVPVTTTLTGSVTDDGLPLGAMLTATWNVVSGVAPVSFGTPTATFSNVANQAHPVTTSATFCRVNPYVLSLTGSDSLLSSSSNVAITINAPPIPTAPTIVSVNPGAGVQGQQNISVTISGQLTNFVQGTSQASFGAGITVTTVTVANANSLTAQINIDPNATLGARSVTVTTGAEVASLANGFAVQAGTPALLSVTPNAGQQGQQNLPVTITGQFTHFVQGTTTASFGAGITVTALTVSSATTATALLNIDPAAAVGPRTIAMTTGGELASLPSGFSVSATPVLTQVNPNSGQQGQQHLLVAITGQFTHFSQGTTQVTFGNGITLCGATVTSATTLTAEISIGITAVPGPRTVAVQTGTEHVSLAAGFTILPAASAAALTWTQLNPTGSLPEGMRTFFGANAYNPNSNRLVVLGATPPIINVLSNANSLGGTPQWSQQSTLPDPANGFPPPLLNQGGTGQAAYDVLNNRLILFGGCAGHCGPVTNQTWVLTDADGSAAGQTPTWLMLSPTGGPPAPRWLNTAVYDPNSNTMTIFGGGDAASGTFNNYSDVWVLNNANGLAGPPTWVQLSPTGGPPLGQRAATAVYDGATRSMIVFGGSLSGTGGGASNAVWLLSNANGQGGAPVWTNIVPEGAPGSPPTRTLHSSVYDACANRMTVFGGALWSPINGTSNYYNDSWTLANANGVSGNPAWIELNPTGGPPSPRFGSSAMLDGVSGRMTIFGGEDAVALPTDTWILSGLTGVPKALLSVAPGAGQPGQMLTVTLTGLLTTFQQGTTQANFGAGITLASLTVNSPTSATAIINIDPAAAAGPRKVTLTTGADVVSLDGGFTVVAVGTPVLTLVNPNTGQPGQQNLSVTINGQLTHWVQGSTSANFGPGITVAALTISSATTATAMLNIDPATAVGARTVVLTTGSEIASLVNGFSVTSSPATPVLTQVSPNSGQQGQGGPLGVVGQNTHFVQGVTTLDLGTGITVSSVTVTCDTCLTAQVVIGPNAAVGPRTVTATTGAEVAQLVNGFTVLAGTPILTSMVPASGRQGQSVTSTITGQSTNWVQGTTTVSLGAGITVNTVTVTNSTTLTVQLTVASNAALGLRNLTVTTGTEIVSASNVFNVLAGLPVVSLVNPSTGQQGQSSLPITITGQFTNFVQGTSQVSFGAGITVSSVTVASLTSLTANVSIAANAAAGSRTVTVSTGTEIASLANGFAVVSAGPALVSVNPNTGQPGQSGPVTITGQSTNFVQGTTQVSLGAGITVGNVTVTSATSLTAQITVTANAAVGGRTVTVTTGNEIASLTNGFTVQDGTPILTFIDPASGQQGQSLPVAVTGQFTNWVQGTTTVNLGADITVGAVTITDSTHLTAQVSIAANATIGSRTATVTTGTEIESVPNAFDVVAAGPRLVSASPSSGQEGQANLSVAIVGLNTHFVQGTSQATFGSTAVVVNSIAVTDASHLTANITIAINAAPVARTVVVTTGTEIATLPNGFTVTAGTNQAPVITIAPTWSVTLPNRLMLTYTVTDDGLPFGGTLTTSWDTIATPAGATVGYLNQMPSSISAGFSDPGTYTLRITATDSQLTVFQNVTVTVTGNPIPPPTVSLTSPIDGAEITAPVSVVGTADSPNLASWTLEFKPIEETVFRTLATGTTPVTNGVLGTFDPTVLLNGIVQIQLSATDTFGQTTTVGPISVVLTKNQKIGNFTVSFNDLSVPVAGLPIQIVRTYDSRSRILGDFGAGWTLDLRTVRLSESIIAGDQWNTTVSGGLIKNYCVQPAKPHVVSVALPDGTEYTFDLTLSGNCQQIVPPSQVAIGFTPRPGSNASLTVLGNNLAEINGPFPGTAQLLDLNTAQVFDADKYRLTLPDGRMLDINQTTGGLEKMTDLNGNTLTVSSAGIIHSSGKSVLFTRDNVGRITQITDPAGNKLNYVYLGGDLSTFTDRENNTTTFGYDGNHGLLSIQDPRGIQPIKNVYDNAGRLIQHIDAFGNVINYTHSLNTQEEIVTDRLGNITVNQYDSDGNVVKVTDALGGVTTRTYDSHGNVLTETNSNGKTRTYTYDAQDNRLTETDPLGNKTAYTFNGTKQVLTTSDPLSRLTTNTYDTSGNLRSTKDPLGNVTSYTYTAQGLRSSMTDPLGNITSYQYDASGNLTQQTDPLGNVTTYTYDGNGNKLSETKTRTTASGPETLITSYQYNKNNQLIQTTYADGSTTQTAYNSIGKAATATDQLGRITAYSYDAMGRVIETDFPDGTSEKATYDAEGRRIASTDRGNRTTSYLNDPLGRLTKTTFPDTAFTTTTYDPVGQVTRVTDARGNATTYAYDDAGRRTQVTDALTNVTTFLYDAAGNQTSMTDARTNTTQYQYDNDNRRTKVIYADTTSDQTGYDALGRTISKTDQAAVVTQYQYDKLGRLTTVTDALHQPTSYTYDEVGNRLTQTDANGHTTTFAYDKLGRRTKRFLPLGMAETMTYDTAGNLKTKTDFNGKTTTYAYDSVNRLLSQTPDASLGEPMVSFTYTASGQRASMADASGSTNYAYDLRDRLVTKATPEGTLTYTYDLQGNLTTIRSSNAGGTSVDYAYDALNRLSTTKDNRLTPGMTAYSYDAAGNLGGYVYPNGVQTSYAYNTLNRLASMSLAKTGTVASYTYTLGAAGNRTAVSERGGRQVNYTYDALYRLTNESIAGGTVNGAIGYTYDAVGNRLSRTSTVVPVPAATSSYDANDRLTTDTYDNNGNTTISGGNIYGYDFANHLKSQTGGTAVTIVYDGDGNRVAKTVAGVTTKYLVDDRSLTGYAQVLEEIAGGTVQRVYTYGLSRISQSQVSGTSFYGYDGHGSVRLLSDSSGAVTDLYDYDAFGNVTSQSGTTPNAYLYSGEQSDPSLGFYYMRARYYSSTSGRFQSTDPFEGIRFDPPTLHRYAYVGQNAPNRRDPSGKLTLPEVAATSAIVGILSGALTYHITGDAGKSLLVGVGASAGALALGSLAVSASAALVSGSTIAGVSQTEIQIIEEAKELLASPEMTQLRAAFQSGQSVVVKVGETVIQYEPNLPASGMTMSSFGENGFLLGPQAFSSGLELTRTVLQEVYRLTTSSILVGGTATQQAITEETQAAFQFAQRIGLLIFK